MAAVQSLPLSISTDQFAPQDRLPFWHDVFGRTMLKLSIDPLGDAPFHCDATLQALPGLSLAALTTSPTRVSRTRAMVADCNDDILLSIPREGTTFVSHLGRDASIAEGGCVLTSAAEPGMLAFRSAAQFTVIGVPTAALMPMVRDIDHVLMQPIRPDTPALRLLTGYVDLLLQGPSATSAELQRSAVAHVYDLIALMVGAARDAAHVATGRGARTARFAAIRADILQNLAQVRLSPKMMAKRHGVTERYIHLLFAETGETFGAFVTAARLDRAHALLLDPASEAITIGDIAQRVGFGEITTFNRAFRRRFGDTPSALRARRAA